MTLTNQEWSVAFKVVLEKATHEPEFLARCLSEPSAAFRAATGLALPEDRGSDFLTGIDTLRNGELSDAHLDKVAGGFMPVKNTKPPWENP